MADGATIQVCNEVALKQGVGLERCLSFVRDARADGLTTPVVLMGYYNPFRARAGRAGPASAGRAQGEGRGDAACRGRGESRRRVPGT